MAKRRTYKRDKRGSRRFASTGSPRVKRVSRKINRRRPRYVRGSSARRASRPRGPHTSPSRLPSSTIDLIIELREKLCSKGLDNGPHTIAWHLQHHHQLTVSPATISRHLSRAGLITECRSVRTSQVRGGRRPAGAAPPSPTASAAPPSRLRRARKGRGTAGGRSR